MASPSIVHLIGFDIRTKEHILCVSLRLCVKSLLTWTARTFVDIFVSRKGAKFRKEFAGKISVCYAGWGRRHNMTSLRVLEVSPNISFVLIFL